MEEALNAAQIGIQTANFSKLSSMEGGIDSIRIRTRSIEDMLAQLLRQSGMGAQEQQRLLDCSIGGVGDVLLSPFTQLSHAIGKESASKLRQAAEKSVRARPSTSTGRSSVVVELPVGSSLFSSKYIVLDRIGNGSFGSVFSVRDLLLDQLRVVKLLRCGAADIEGVLREGRILSRLDHPNIVSIVTMEQQREEDGNILIGIIMPLVDGLALDVVLRVSVMLSEERVRRIAVDILSALSYIHSLSPPVYHRDIKPGNILFSAEDDRYVLIDFGLARDALDPLLFLVRLRIYQWRWCVVK